MPRRDDKKLRSFEDVATDYEGVWLPKVRKELSWWRRAKDPADAIRRACESRMPSGVLHDHQQRPFGVWPDAPGVAAKALLARQSDIMNAENFEALYALIEQALRSVRGIGPLAVYDIAHRVGVFIGLEPTKVVLHRGTRAGAVALGIPAKGQSVAIDSLPIGLHKLTAVQLEDVLCLYQATLARIRRSNTEAQSSIPQNNDPTKPL
jgi:hypothetical protein